MPLTPNRPQLMQLSLLEESQQRYSAQLKKLECLWGPLQKYASSCALLLCVIGVIASLLSQTYYHWLITAPIMCILMTLDFVIEDVQRALTSMSDEVHYVLDVSRTVHTTAVPPNPALASGDR